MALDPITAALNIGNSIIERIWPDPAQAAAAKLQLLQMQQTGELAQMTADTDLAKGQEAVNAVEAANKSVFVSGWRPFVGWVCGVSFAVAYVVVPFISSVDVIVENWGHFDVSMLPKINAGDLMPLLTGMLGFAGLRTYEKTQGVASK